MPLSGDARAAMSESLAETIPFVSRLEIEVCYVEFRVPIEPNRHYVGTMYGGRSSPLRRGQEARPST